MITTLLLLASLFTPVQRIADPSITPAQPPAPSPDDTLLEMKCMPRAQLVSHIKTGNHAVPLFVAVSAKSGASLEFWRDTSNPDRQMWISFITHGDGISCIVMQGDGFGLADPNAVYVAPKPNTPPGGKPVPHPDSDDGHL